MRQLDEKGLEAAFDVLWPLQEWNGEESACRAATKAAVAAYLQQAGGVAAGPLSELQGREQPQVGGNHSHLSVGVSDSAEIIEGLIEASNQIEYLHGKFQETGSGNAVIAKLTDLRRRLQSAALDGGQP